MGRFKVVMLDTILLLSDIERNELVKIDADIVQHMCATPEEIWAAASDADAVIQIYTRMSREAISGLKKCKVIAHCGIGLDSVDIPAATEAGIAVCNVPQYCQEEVATMAIALMMNVERRLAIADKAVRSGNWREALRKTERARSFAGKIIGLVGFGSIARCVVPKAQAFDMQVLAYDPYINHETAHSMNVEPVSLEELLKRSDYVSIHVPLSKDTFHLIGEKEISMMKPNSILINTARGPIVDQQALTAALQCGHLAGAGLDVLETEPPSPDDPILSLDNVLITGHTASATLESIEWLRLQNIMSVVSVLKGEVPKQIVNPEVLNKALK